MMHLRMSQRLIGASDWLYRLLLHAYPATFRECYGGEMAQVFRECCREAYRRRGAVGLAGLWARTLSDLVISAIDQHIVGGSGMFLKRLFDITLALAALIVLAPILAAIAILIKLDSRGPVFYRGLRVGRNGRLFTMYKFRTMSEQAGIHQITRLGRMLRAADLDELPQLLNVLAGDMSLIGPRPRLPHEVSLADADWQRALTLRPGMTGVAQLTYGLNRVDDRTMREVDLEYLKRRSLKMDIKLLLRTFVMLTRQIKRAG